MLCEAMCDAGGPNQLFENAPNGAFFVFYNNNCDLTTEPAQESI